MNGRDTQGRFAHGNDYASLGGKARAETLPASRRREIARAGWLALVARRYNGDATAAARAIVRAGNGDDVIYFGHTF